MANTQLNKSVQKNAGNDNITKMTFSAWIKRNALGEGIIFAAHQLSTYYTHFYFNSDDRIQIYSYINSSTAANLVLERRFRDTNAWYHIVLTIDTTLGTDSDRMKVYVNGVRETVTNGGTTYPSQSSAFGQFSDTGATLNIGNTANRAAFNGLMSHVHYTPYSAYDASPFGSTDATTGEWKINTTPNVTYSTAGFFILKDGNSVTDQSPNTNNFTVGAGTLTKTEDCPSNVFCTLNFLDKRFDNTTLTNGNLTCTGGRQSTGFDMIRGTIGAISGKYYYEVKAVDNAEIDQIGIGIINNISPQNQGASGLNGNLQGYGVQMSNGYKVGVGQSGATYMGGFSANQILQVAIDLDNDKITFGRNGSWADGSGNANQTYANSTAAFTGLNDSRGYIPMFAQRDSGNNNPGTMQFNFGNGYFGTTAVSSAGTNASNNGIFEYDVPTGFTALSTKGLNE